MDHRILRQTVRTMERVVHDATHDVESFVWVLSYCVMRNLYHRASQRSAPKEVRDQRYAFRSMLRQAFGQTMPKAIATERQTWSFCLTFPLYRDVSEITTNFMSDALVALFKDLQGLIHPATDPFNPTPLTHDALLAVVNQRLASLQ
ncbi:hypothetical protein M378DRAFT_15802 [Amanita muscaria Koide BX008]|uniref:Fungal-type protein kinase domain-containing protein n=1 Tax=Amanita muscaria (strain Koide BX008) TaxID=946122 RepID=A0A0C2SVH2_AMAMK|nr:hypothetical protein M378DRAFT_15802 [Amanita muscaria Koide BX008]